MHRLALSLLLVLLLMSSPARAENVTGTLISYGSHKLQNLTVFQPAQCKTRKCPVTLWVHGGGWRNGNSNQRHSKEMLTAWAEKGVVMVGVNYRLSPEVVHPAHVQDVAAAISWVHNHIGDYGGDPGRISLLGHSAGAHLVALVATNPAYLDAYGLSPGRNIANVFPIDTASFDLTRPSRFVQNMVETAFGTDTATLQEASPIWKVTPGHRYPRFIIAAVKIRKDAVATSEALKEKLENARTEADLLIMDYPGARQLKAHGLIAKELKDIHSPMTSVLLEQVLRGS